MKDNELSVDAYLNPERWGQMEKLAQSLVSSRAFPKSVQNAHQALVLMQAGTEMGLKPLEAINGLAIINGQIGPWGKTTIKLLRNHGWKVSYEDSDANGGSCTATVTKDDESYSDTVTYQNAVKSKWTTMWDKTKQKSVLKAGWYEGENRIMKLRYNALSKIIKNYIPEVLGSTNDIAEVLEDFVIIEQPATDTDDGTKNAKVMDSTPSERKTNLSDFLEKEKNNPNKQPKPIKKAKKTAKKVEKSTKTVINEADKAEAQEAEIVKE